MGLLQSIQEFVAKDTAENLDRQEETRMRRDPASVIRGQAAAGHHAMDMRMSVQGLSPGMQNTEKADFGAETFGIGGHFQKRMRRTAATKMTSMGIPRLTVQKILNHAEPGVTKIYDRYSYDREKREALEAWSKRLMVMVSDLRETRSGA